MDAPALAVLEIHAEILENLQPLRAIFDILLQLGRGAPAIIGIIDAREIEIGEDHEALGIPFLQDLDVFLQTVPVAAAQVHHDAEIDPVHIRDQLVDVIGRQPVLTRPSHDHRGTGSPAGTPVPLGEYASTSPTAHVMYARRLARNSASSGSPASSAAATKQLTKRAPRSSSAPCPAWMPSIAEWPPHNCE